MKSGGSTHPANSAALPRGCSAASVCPWGCAQRPTECPRAPAWTCWRRAAAAAARTPAGPWPPSPCSETAAWCSSSWEVGAHTHIDQELRCVSSNDSRGLVPPSRSRTRIGLWRKRGPSLEPFWVVGKRRAGANQSRTATLEAGQGHGRRRGGTAALAAWAAERRPAQAPGAAGVGCWAHVCSASPARQHHTGLSQRVQRGLRGPRRAALNSFPGRPRAACGPETG